MPPPVLRKLAPRSVRQIVFLVVTLGFVLLTSAQYLATGSLFTGQLREVESRNAFQRLNALRAATELMLEDLNSTAADWAEWDDTYEFVQGQRPDFIAENLDPSTFQRLRLSVLIIVDQHGRATFAKTVSTSPMTLQEVPQDLMTGAVAAASGHGADAKRISGLLNTSRGPFLISSYAVRDSLSTQPAKGRLIMGRSLDSVLPSLSRLADGRATIESTQGFAAHMKNVRVEFQHVSGRDVLFFSNARVDAHMPLDDLSGRQIGTLHLQTDRPLYASLCASHWSLLWSTLLIGTIFCIAAALVLQSFLVAPIEKLARSVTVIGIPGSLQKRVDEQHQMIEFESLSKSINAMLQQIEMQQDLRSDRDAAITANRLKSEFLATVSHEIRTPMNGVLGMCELLQRTELSPRQRHLSDTVLRSARSLLGILNDILDFSKIESGKLQLEATSFDPRELISNLSAPFVAAAHAKGVELTTQIDAKIPGLVIGDALRLRQVMNNLIANAVKFTSVGAITIDCSIDDLSIDHITLRIAVTDTGIGIPPAALEHIFEPFAQAESRTARQFGGTGLGLAIVRRLVKLMGGTVGLQSDPGVGSRFWFTARLQRSAARSLPTVTEPDMSTGVRFALPHTPVVLLAEDHDVNREVLTEMLEVFSCRVIAVQNGELAVAALSSMPFDVVFMDCQMPLMDGQTATQKLRELERTSGANRTFVVALTADATAANRQRCYDAGMDLVVTKPISQTRLRELVCQAMRTSKTRSVA